MPTLCAVGARQGAGELSALTRPGRDLKGQRRIGIAIGPGLGVGRDREGALTDGQVGARIVHGVVARPERALVDGVDADILAVVAGERPAGCRR